MAHILDVIAQAKAAAGPAAWLWLHDSGDCILWQSRAASLDENSATYAVGRWLLAPETAAAVEAAGLVDELA